MQLEWTKEAAIKLFAEALMRYGLVHSWADISEWSGHFSGLPGHFVWGGHCRCVRKAAAWGRGQPSRRLFEAFKEGTYLPMP